MRNVIFSCALLILGFVSLTTAAEIAAPEKPSPKQIKAWRQEGPAAVDRLMREREKLLAAAKQVTKNNIPELPVWQCVNEINETIDKVAAARYSHESGLYWYTDEDEAYRVAKAQSKPVLALRLLGNLDEELSCANSRYFRILLYPDDKVRQLLHDKFILTWKSVRPVPKITIDLGDGRKVERTITGNSVHYVVLPDGKVVDLFPGLYGPVPFVERLVKAESAAQRAIRAHEAKAEISAYQKQQIADLRKAWNADVAKYEAWRRQVKQTELSAEFVGHVPQPPLTFWEVAARFHPEYSELSKASAALIKREERAGEFPARESLRPRRDFDYAFTKGGDENAISMLVACIQPTLQADTVYNEYCGRYPGLQLLNPDSSSLAAEYLLFDAPFVRMIPTLEQLNDYVYSQIFHYQLDDPWIGLARFDSLTALPKDRGLKRAERKE